VVVDHEDGADITGELAETAGERQEVAPREGFVAELEDFGAAPEGGGSQDGDAVGVLVWGDDIETGGEQAVVERGWRGPVNLPNFLKRSPARPRGR
jgi:hypothetical protein